MKVSKYWRRALPVFGAAFLCTAAWAQEETPTTRPAYVDDILTKISELSTSVSTLSTNVDAISTSVAAIDTSVGEVNTTVAGLGGSVDTLSNNVDAIDTSVGEVNTTVADLGGSLDTLSNNVDAVDTTVDDISTSVAGVNTTVDALSGSVNDTGDDVDDVISKINRLLRRVDDLETAIEALEDDVGLPATKPQQAYFRERSVPNNTWRQVLNHSGVGLLHQVEARGDPGNATADIRVTVDGSTPIVFSDNGEVILDAGLLPVLIRFEESLLVEMRAAGTSININYESRVYYSTDL